MWGIQDKERRLLSDRGKPCPYIVHTSEWEPPIGKETAPLLSDMGKPCPYIAGMNHLPEKGYRQEGKKLVPEIGFFPLGIVLEYESFC